MSVWAAVKQKHFFSKAVFFCKDSPSCQQVFFSKDSLILSPVCLFFKGSPSCQQFFFSKILCVYYLSFFQRPSIFFKDFFLACLFFFKGVFFAKHRQSNTGPITTKWQLVRCCSVCVSMPKPILEYLLQSFFFSKTPFFPKGLLK